MLLQEVKLKLVRANNIQKNYSHVCNLKKYSNVKEIII